MALYLITYDLRAPGRNYQKLYDQLHTWKAAKAAESVWLAELIGPASIIRDLLQVHVDGNDRLFVIQQFSNTEWAGRNVLADGLAWLKRHIP
jgi:hypothetical protein